MKKQKDITRLLNDWRTGDPALMDQILPAVYDELHRVAQSYMRGQPAQHTLQATALINEAFSRLGDVKTELENRGHFIGIVANIMRQILVDHARAKQAQKRGGGVQKVPIDEGAVGKEDASTDVLALEAVLADLEKKDPRKVRIAELYYFCGGTYAETAAALDISEATLHRELRMLRALLARRLKD
ncbi:MAG: ECF-type sigma factor [Pseudomonadota bacterium]